MSNYVHLNRAIIPTIKGYEDAGDFTVKERLKTSIRANLLYYEIVGSIGFFGIVLIIIMHHDWYVLIFRVSTELTYCTTHLISVCSSFICVIFDLICLSVL
jgi:hypothetical protein